MRKTVKIGDVLEIPLKDSKRAFGQFVYIDKFGPLVQIFKAIVETNSLITLEQIINSGPLFPPVITGVKAAVKHGVWKIIGNISVKNFKNPKFISTFYNEKTGEAGKWFLWDGTKTIEIGKKVPKKFQNLEYLIVWPPADVVHRIETGEYPFPYKELIINNRYIPRKKID